MLNVSSSFCCFSLNLKVPAETGSWINSDWCFITGAGLQNRGIRILVCVVYSGENERKQQIAAAVCHSWISLADLPIIHRDVIPSHAYSGASPRRSARPQQQQREQPMNPDIHHRCQHDGVCHSETWRGALIPTASCYYSLLKQTFKHGAAAAKVTDNVASPGNLNLWP